MSYRSLGDANKKVLELKLEEQRAMNGKLVERATSARLSAAKTLDSSGLVMRDAARSMEVRGDMAIATRKKAALATPESLVFVEKSVQFPDDAFVTHTMTEVVHEDWDPTSAPDAWDPARQLADMTEAARYRFPDALPEHIDALMMLYAPLVAPMDAPVTPAMIAASAKLADIHQFTEEQGLSLAEALARVGVIPPLVTVHAAATTEPKKVEEEKPSNLKWWLLGVVAAGGIWYLMQSKAPTPNRRKRRRRR